MENNPKEWTTDQVGCWLKEIGLQKYEKLFCEEHLIDGQILLQLTESDLKQPPVSMNVLGDIKRIIYELGLLKHQIEIRPVDEFPNEIDQYRCNKIKLNQQIHTKYMSSKMSDINSIFGESRSCVSTFLEPEFPKLFVATIYLLLVLLLTTYTMVVVHDWVPNMDKYPPLPDIALNRIPYIPWAFEACEITTLIMGAILFAILVFHKYRFIVIRRLFALSGTVFLLRCFTMMITSLSVPGKHLQCEPRPLGDFTTRLEMALKIYSGFGMSIQGVRTCGDYMFSGHTVVVTMLNFFITEYTPRSQLYLLHIFSWVANFFAIFFILAAHEHYSIDVFIAFYITSRLFLYYHSLANNQVLSHKDSRTRRWFPVFAFFENSLNGGVPNLFELPWTTFSNYLVEKVRKFSESHNKSPPIQNGFDSAKQPKEMNSEHRMTTVNKHRRRYIPAK